MIDFIVYLNSRQGEELKIKVKELDLNKLKSWPSTSSLRELSVVVEGKLRFMGDYSSHNAFRFYAKYYPRISRLAKERVIVPAEFTLWQVKENPFVIAFNIPREVARAGAALMSLMLYNDAFAIIPIKLDSTDFIRLREIVKGKSGKFAKLHLRRTGGRGKVVLTGLNLEEEYQHMDFDQLLRNASKIHSLGFILSPPVVERTLSFRITEWGGGQIYSPSNPLDHEVLLLLNLFREAFFPSF